MRRTLLLLLLVFLVSLPVRTRADAATTPVPPVTLSEVYGGGGNDNATYANDYVELFNRTRQAVDLTGWTVGYSSKESATWTSVRLAGVLNPYRYFLVKFGTAGGTGTATLPAPDATSATNIARTAGKIRLASPSGSVADLFGWGSGVNGFEGRAFVPPTDNVKSMTRIDSGCTDTNRNDKDFTNRTPAPRSRASSGHGCGHYPVLDPIGPKKVQANKALTFTVSGSDADGDPITFSAAPLPAGARFTPSTRTFEWVPTQEQVGTHDVVFKVWDGFRGDKETVRITVSPDPFVGRSEITLEVSQDTRRMGARGEVIPAHAGDPVTVKLFRYESGSFRRIGLTRTTLDVNSRYQAGFPRPAAGRCLVNATFHGDEDHPRAHAEREVRC